MADLGRPAGEALQLLAKEEDPHEGLRRIGDEEPGEALDLRGFKRLEVAAVGLPERDQGVGRRVVLVGSLLVGLGAHLAGGEAAGGGGLLQSVHQPGPGGLHPAGDGGGHRGVDVALGDERVDQAERLGLAVADRPAGQHGRHGLDGIDQPGQPGRPAEAWMKPELHLGEAIGGAFHADAGVTGERQLQPPAERRPMHYGDHGDRQRLKPVDHGVRAGHGVDPGLHLGDLTEPADVGAIGKAAPLARADHQRLGPELLQPVEEGVQLLQQRLVQGVGAGAPLVQDGPGHVVLVAGHAPVRVGAVRRRRRRGPQLQVAVLQRLPDGILDLAVHRHGVLRLRRVRAAWRRRGRRRCTPWRSPASASAARAR